MTRTNYSGKLNKIMEGQPVGVLASIANRKVRVAAWGSRPRPSAKLRKIMSDFRKKLPIELDYTFMCHIMYRYSKETRLYIVPKNYPGATKIEQKETYWLPEKHAIVQDTYVAYHSDHSLKDFNWKPDTDMSKAMARYGFECLNIDSKKLKAVTKSELVKSGIIPELHPSKDDEDITKEFATKPREFWRFKKRWDRSFEEFTEWDDNAEVLIFHFSVHRFSPELPIYDWYIRDHLLQQEREKAIQLSPQPEKVARKKKSNKKKTVVKKAVNKKTAKKK